MKQYLICPNCFTNGSRQVLGQLDENGNLIIRRHSNGSTKIISPMMIVQCGVCNEVVFYRKKKHGKSSTN